MYIVCIKENTAVAVAICKDIEKAKAQYTMYDDVQEITADTFYNIPIPSKLINGKWEKTDSAPVVEYPQEEITPLAEEKNISVYDELAAAYKEGVQEA